MNDTLYNSNNNLLIFIEGNIRTGKASLISGLAKHLSKYSENIYTYFHPKDYRDLGPTTTTDSRVPIEININDMFNMDPNRWACEFFIINLTNKINFMRTHLRGNHNSIIIIERSIDTESLVFIQSLYDCCLISYITYTGCMNIVKELSDIFKELRQITTYIYMRSDPTDLFDCIISHNVYDCLNYNLLSAIHRNYEHYITSLSVNSVANPVITVDVPYEQILKPNANIIKGLFKRLQHIYPIFQDSVE